MSLLVARVRSLFAFAFGHLISFRIIETLKRPDAVRLYAQIEATHG